MNYVLRGKYLEDFTVGQIIRTGARTVCEGDVSLFAGLTGDYNPLHTNEEFAKTETVFGTRIAHGLLGLTIMSGLLNQMGLMEGTCIAFIESSERFKSPLLFGDTVFCEVEVIDIKFAKKPDRGILTMTNKMYNQRDELVTEQTQVLMMKRKPV